MDEILLQIRQLMMRHCKRAIIARSVFCNEAIQKYYKIFLSLCSFAVVRKFLIFILLGMWSLSSFAANIKTIKPYLGSIQKSFTEPARTYLEKTYTINMPIGGELERIIVREGNRVKKGQLVAMMEQEPLRQAVNKAIAHLRTIEAQFALQQKTVWRFRKLDKKGFIEKAQLDQVVAKNNALKAEIVEAKSEVAIAKYNLEQSILKAPIEGMILNRYTQGGKWLPEGTPLLRIGTLEELEVICDVLTQEAQELRVGGLVFLSSIGSTAILQGKVKQIYPAGFTKKSSLGVDEQRVNVIIAVKDSHKIKLGLDYRLQAKFLIGSREDKAIIVPRFSILQNSKGDYYVFVVRNGRIYQRIIKVGVLTDEKVSIRKGLSVSDIIVDQPTSDMRDGMKI